MTGFSRFIIKEKYGDNFYDFKKTDCRIREFVYTIDLQALKNISVYSCNSTNNNNNNSGNTNNDYFEKLNKEIFDYMNSTKTLLARVSTIVLPNSKNEKKPTAYILLETKLSKMRQNFDDIIWKKLFKNYV
jgi:hypothetical protein